LHDVIAFVAGSVEVGDLDGRGDAGGDHGCVKLMQVNVVQYTYAIENMRAILRDIPISSG